jgi:hypothetical protein
MTTSALSPSPIVIDLADPLYAIEHVARLFLVEVDTAREFTYRSDFPAPIKIGRRWLWFPDEVLAWTRKQPRYSVEQRKRGGPAATAATPALKHHSSYRPRAGKSAVSVREAA